MTTELSLNHSLHLKIPLLISEVLTLALLLTTSTGSPHQCPQKIELSSDRSFALCPDDHGDAKVYAASGPNDAYHAYYQSGLNGWLGIVVVDQTGKEVRFQYNVITSQVYEET